MGVWIFEFLDVPGASEACFLGFRICFLNWGSFVILNRIGATSPGQSLTGGGNVPMESAGRPTYVAPSPMAIAPDLNGRDCVHGRASGMAADSPVRRGQSSTVELHTP